MFGCFDAVRRLGALVCVDQRARPCGCRMESCRRESTGVAGDGDVTRERQQCTVRSRPGKATSRQSKRRKRVVAAAAATTTTTATPKEDELTGEKEAGIHGVCEGLSILYEAHSLPIPFPDLRPFCSNKRNARADKGDHLLALQPGKLGLRTADCKRDWDDDA